MLTARKVIEEIYLLPFNRTSQRNLQKAVEERLKSFPPPFARLKIIGQAAGNALAVSVQDPSRAIAKDSNSLFLACSFLPIGSSVLFATRFTSQKSTVSPSISVAPASSACPVQSAVSPIAPG